MSHVTYEEIICAFGVCRDVTWLRNHLSISCEIICAFHAHSEMHKWKKCTDEMHKWFRMKCTNDSLRTPHIYDDSHLHVCWIAFVRLMCAVTNWCVYHDSWIRGTRASEGRSMTHESKGMRWYMCHDSWMRGKWRAWSPMYDGTHSYEGVMSHIWMSHGTCMNKSWHS